MHDYPGRGALAHSRRWRHPYMAALLGLLAPWVSVAACGGGNKGSGVASLAGSKQPTSTSTTTAAGGREGERQRQAQQMWRSPGACASSASPTCPTR